MTWSDTKGTSLSLIVLVGALGLVGGSRANADFTFGEPVNLGPLVNCSHSDFTACISADELSLFFASNRSPGGYQDFDLWVATRQAKDEDWDAPVNLGDVLNSRQNQWTPFLSAGGLELYFASGPWGNTDIVVTRRNSLAEPWGPAESLGPMVNSTGWDGGPSITADGLELYFESARSGNPDLYVSTRAATSDPWGPAMNLGSTVNSFYGNASYGDQGPVVSPDGLILFFSSARPPGSSGSMNIWMTRRATREDQWQSPVLLGPPVNTGWSDWTACVSADGRTFYFVSSRPDGYGGDSDFWQTSILPVVDFDGDGKVGGREVLTMAECLGQDAPLCDIGPMPWGDGIVDVQDLIVLADYIGKDVVDGTLIAHWALDEMEGDIAYDSAGANDGTLVGEPVWESEDGIVDGALGFDGVDDHIVTERGLNPSDGAFSVLAWIKGGAPGQVLISQVDGTNWLMADPVAGTLMTELSPPAGRTPIPPLVSECLITDGNWHRVGLVWDGMARTLYVDDVLVAEDMQSGLAACSGGLNIGCGESMDPSTFFSGLIDDVRLYNRAVTP